MIEVKRWNIHGDEFGAYRTTIVSEEPYRETTEHAERDEYVFASDYDHLESELAQLRTERDKLIKAIETHRSNVWGELDAEHDQDIELYEVLDSIDYKSNGKVI